jgi:uncharacterized protein (DUF2267 family)
MAQAGTDIDATVHKTNEWLHRIQEHLETDDRHVAYTALRASLHAVRDRLPVEQIARLGAQLPLLVRGLYYEGWKPRPKPLRIRHAQDFYAIVRGEIPPAMPLHAAAAARASFDVLREHIDPGELRKIGRLLPRDLAAIWLGPAGEPRVSRRDGAAPRRAAARG